MLLTRRGAHTSYEKEKDGPFRILDLPPELVEIVFGHLASEEPKRILSARLVCRAFNNHSLAAFGTTFFNHLYAILDPLSLIVLIEIASHRSLAKFVRQVSISGEQLDRFIGLRPHRDEQALMDLQTSMGRSGLDQMILTNVFRKLPRLVTVRIHSGPHRGETEVLDAVRCGSRYINSTHPKYDVYSILCGSNRAFKTFFTSLRNSGLAGKVGLEMHVYVSTLVSLNIDLFDPTSADWVHDFASKVQLLELSGEISSRWTLDLLQSTSNLQALQLSLATSLFQFSHPDTGPIFWPRLRRIRLYLTNCRAHTLVDFLCGHRQTLSDLHFRGVALIAGSWREPLRIIEGMPKLEHMFLFQLEETAPHAPLIHVSSPGEVVIPKLILHTNTASRVALGAILRNFRITPRGIVGAFYGVDLRPAQAALDGSAAIRDIEYDVIP